MKRAKYVVLVVIAAMIAHGLGAAAWADEFDEARIYIEYNESDNDLGFHVFLDGEDWTELQIFDPDGKTIIDLKGKGGYKELGLTTFSSITSRAVAILLDRIAEHRLDLSPPRRSGSRPRCRQLVRRSPRSARRARVT